jgi:outer membrane protein TolC
VRPVPLILRLLLVCGVGATPVAAQVQAPAGPPPERSRPASQPSPSPSISQFFGGVPSGEPTREPLLLTISDALNRALANNLGVLLAEEGIGRARGARWRAVSELLPNVNGRISEARQVVNLAAFGFPLPAGIPPVVGPFNLFDARVYLSQSVLDFKARNDARAEAHNVAAARYDYKSARDLVVLVATISYAQAIASSARVDAAHAQVDTAQALFTQATDLKQSGIVAGIDVLRAEVQLSTERQRSTSAQNELEKAKLQLARLIGLPLGQTFTLANELPDVGLPDMTLEQALARAVKTRPDYLAALERVKAAEATRQAAAGEMLPAIRVTANYGDLGVSPSDSHSTYNVAGAVDVPIFQGGRSRGRLLEADADIRRRRADADDLKGAIYYEVRTALLDLQTGREQLQVGTRARELAASQLTQARDRFAAGVAGNIEIVQAQAAVTQANDEYIAALYTTNLAKGSLVRAIGIAEETARQVFGGLR